VSVVRVAQGSKRRAPGAPGVPEKSAGKKSASAPNRLHKKSHTTPDGTVTGEQSV
jgi:hypothetical protein